MYPLPSSQPPLGCSLLMLLMTPKVINATEPKIWQDIRENTVCVYFRTRVASIHRVAEKAHSRKPRFIHPHSYKVPRRRQEGLISELPRRVLLGNWLSGKGRSRKPGRLPPNGLLGNFTRKRSSILGTLYNHPTTSILGHALQPPEGVRQMELYVNSNSTERYANFRNLATIVLFLLWLLRFGL